MPRKSVATRMREEWVVLLRNELVDMNRLQYVHDRRYYVDQIHRGEIEAGYPMYPHGRFIEDFDPEDAQSVLDNLPTVRRCLHSLRYASAERKFLLPNMDSLPAAIRKCRDLTLYFEDWAAGLFSDI